VKKLQEFIREISKGTIIKVTANLIADAIKTGLWPLILAFVLAVWAWAKGWLTNEVIIPFWVLLVYSLVLLLVPIALKGIVGLWKRPGGHHHMRKYYGLLWCVSSNGRVEGPFCPKCKLSMTQQHKDELVEALDLLEGGVGLPTTLQCRDCGIRKDFDLSLEVVRRDIEDRIAAESR
jgi:hypothetical protein